MDLSHLSHIAIEGARAAGKVIRQYMHTDVAVEHKTGGDNYAAQVVTAVDRACEAAILDHLRPTCHASHIALLSEETEDDGSRFEEDHFWCIDPMDGTLPFIHKQPGFSVSIALVARDGTPQIGVVFDPSTDSVCHAISGRGAYKDGSPLQIQASNTHLTYVTDKMLKDTPRAGQIESFLHEHVARLGLTGIKVMAGAGSVLNAIRVVENGPACMLKFPKKENGGGSVWDFAATACIFQELGLPATNYAGGPLDLNRKDGTFMNHEGVFYRNW